MENRLKFDSECSLKTQKLEDKPKKPRSINMTVLVTADTIAVTAT